MVKINGVLRRREGGNTVNSWDWIKMKSKVGNRVMIGEVRFYYGC